MALADATTVYWYDPVKRTPAKILLQSPNVNYIAVDGQRKFVFLAQNTGATGVVTKYKLFTNFTNATDPIVNIDIKEAPVVAYTGGSIHGMQVNELLGVLVLADSSNHKIVAYEYDTDVIKKLNKTGPYVQELVKGVPEVSDLWGVAVYKDKEVVWGNHANGKKNGAVVIASNTADPKTYTSLSKDIDGIGSLVSESNAIYYVDTNSKIYRAKHHNGKFEIDMVHDKISKIKSI